MEHFTVFYIILQFLLYQYNTQILAFPFPFSFTLSTVKKKELRKRKEEKRKRTKKETYLKIQQVPMLLCYFCFLKNLPNRQCSLKALVEWCLHHPSPLQVDTDAFRAKNDYLRLEITSPPPRTAPGDGQNSYAPPPTQYHDTPKFIRILCCYTNLYCFDVCV